MLYAIADTHGRYDLIIKLYEAILQDIQSTKDEYNKILFLGDYIDRGPQSKQILDWLMSLKEANTKKLKHICLLGNHEDFLLQAMDNFGTVKEPPIWQCWMGNGGLATLDSFGIIDYENTAQQIFKPYYKWLKTLPIVYERHNMIFCHSGYFVKNFPVAVQRDALLWGRCSKHAYVGYDKLVIHGHTPTGNGKPYVEINRICIDTGGYYSNYLHAVVLPDKTCTEKDARFIKITV